MQNLKSTFDAVNFTYYDNLCNEIDSKALKLQNNPSLKKELCKLSMEFVYLSPFIRAQIEEENIAEFLLSVEQPLERAIDKFIQKDVPFTAYLRKSLNLRIISFKGQKQREERQSRVMYQFIIPNLQDDFKVSETRHSYSNSNNKEITNVNINKLKYVFSKVPYLRKRFFIYFTSLIPYLPKNLIDIICKELSIDEQQTYKILQYLQTEIPLNKIEKIIEKRNSYYTKYMALEMKLSDGLGILSFEEIEKIKKKININKERLNIKRQNLAEVRQRVPYQTLSNLFAINVDTIGGFCFKTKNLLLFLTEDKECSIQQGVKIQRILEEYKLKAPTNINLKPFYPFEEFGEHLKHTLS